MHIALSLSCLHSVLIGEDYVRVSPRGEWSDVGSTFVPRRFVCQGCSVISFFREWILQGYNVGTPKSDERESLDTVRLAVVIVVPVVSIVLCVYGWILCARYKAKVHPKIFWIIYMICLSSEGLFQHQQLLRLLLLLFLLRRLSR